MIYDLNTPMGIAQFQSRSKWLLGRKVKVDLTQKMSKKTINQNSYIHLLMAYFGSQTGFTKKEIKQLVKKLNYGIFSYKKKDFEFERSFETLEIDEMRIIISGFIKYCEEDIGISMPRPRDIAFLDEARNQVETNREFL